MQTEHPLREEFREYISRALSPTDNTESRDLISFVRGALYRSRAASISPEVVISEAYLKADKSIQNRIDKPCQDYKPINDMGGWYRGICRNVIAEMIDVNIGQEAIAYETAGDTTSATPPELESALSERVVAALLKALESLSSTDKLIFLLRVVDELSWKNVSERVNASSRKKMNEASVRKRGCRIKETLQAAFLANEDLDEEDKEQVCIFIRKPTQGIWK